MQTRTNSERCFTDYLISQKIINREPVKHTWHSILVGKLFLAIESLTLLFFFFFFFTVYSAQTHINVRVKTNDILYPRCKFNIFQLHNVRKNTPNTNSLLKMKSVGEVGQDCDMSWRELLAAQVTALAVLPWRGVPLSW